MRVSFGMDEESRTIYFTPKDPLEIAILDQLSDLCGKGVTMKLIKSFNDVEWTYKVEVKLNGNPSREKANE